MGDTCIEVRDTALTASPQAVVLFLCGGQKPFVRSLELINGLLAWPGQDRSAPLHIYHVLNNPLIINTSSIKMGVV